MDSPRAGQVFGGRFRLGKRLGQGGFGEVSSGWDLQQRQRVAVKLFQLTAEDLDAALPMLEREADMMRRVSVRAGEQGHIAQIRDFAREPGTSTFYLAMDFVRGTPLTALLREAQQDERPFDPEVALHITRQILGALAVVHDEGLVHRDIKPPNIMITERGNEPFFAVLIDFGIARTAADATLGRTFTQVGTPAYMAPEQVEGKPVDRRTDLYALGCVLYHMLAGQPPFARPHIGDPEARAAAIQIAQAMEVVPPLPAEVPPVLAHFVTARLLAKQLEARPADARAALRELNLAAAGEEWQPATVKWAAPEKSKESRRPVVDAPHLQLSAAPSPAGAAEAAGLPQQDRLADVAEPFTPDRIAPNSAPPKRLAGWLTALLVAVALAIFATLRLVSDPGVGTRPVDRPAAVAVTHPVPTRPSVTVAPVADVMVTAVEDATIVVPDSQRVRWRIERQGTSDPVTEPKVGPRAVGVKHEPPALRDAQDDEILARPDQIGAKPAAVERWVVKGDTVYDTKTRLTWQRRVDERDFTWEGAKAYCRGRGGEWRLPSKEELLSIVVHGHGGPTIDRKAFPNTPVEVFWTSTPRVSGRSAWYVYFDAGSSDYDDTSDTSRVRCVR